MSIANTWRWFPDWSSQITERLEWRTDVQQGYDGQEERYALRSVPRRLWSWSMVLDGHARQKFEAEFYASSTATWLVPLWWDVAKATLGAGDTTYVRPDDASREIPAESYLVIADSVGAIGVGPCSYSDMGDEIIHAWVGGLARAFPAGRVYAARFAKVRLDTVEDITAGVTRYQVTAEATADFGVTPVTVEIWPLRPNRIEPLSASWNVLQERVDFGGAWEYDVRRAKPLRGVELSYFYGTRAEVYFLRRALARLAGQYEQATLPTFQADLTVTQPIGGSLVYVEPIGWTASSPNCIMIILRDGTIYNRTVTSSSIVGGAELLAVTPAFTSVIQVEDIRQVSWSRKSRLASDAVEIVWTTPEVATISLPWQEVAE